MVSSNLVDKTQVSPAVAFVVLVLVQLLPINNIGGKWFTPVPAPDEEKAISRSLIERNPYIEPLYSTLI